MFFTTFILIITLSAISDAAKTMEFVKEVDGHPSQCYVTRQDKFYNIGQTGQLNDMCGQVSCNLIEHLDGRNQLVINYMSCGKVWAVPPCIVETKEDLSYPSCCPKALCPKDD